MKLKSVVFLAALAALGLSCGKEVQPVREEAPGFQITASFADAGSKTVLGEEKTSVLWSPNDEISVFYNEDGLRFTSLNSTPKPVVNFVCSKGIIFGTAEDGERPMLYGVYPYSALNEQEGETLILEVPDDQTSVEGSFGRGSFPSVGRSNTTSMAFYNVCGGLRFSLSEDGVTKVVFSGNDGEILAGKVKVRFNEDGVPEVSEVIDGKTSVSLSAPDGGSFRKGEWYYISLLPTPLANGFSFEFRKRSDESERAEKSYSTPVTVKRSIFGSLSNIDAGVSYKVGIASLPVTPASIIMVPGGMVRLSYSISPSDAEYQWVKWSSGNPEVATVDESGKVTAVNVGECLISVSSDNGTVGSCLVYVASHLITTDDASPVESTYATLNGSGDVAGFSTLDKTLYFLYSRTESTLTGLKNKGSRLEARLGETSFSAELAGLPLNTTYYYAAVLEAVGNTYYGEVKSFTTKNLPADAVNLGLSVYWASENVGAASVESYGGYYAWGETTTKSSYSWGSYQLCNGVYNKLKKYINRSNYGTVDNKKKLELSDDTAHSALGGKWRMPTQSEWQELIDNCNWTWTTLNGVSGYEVGSRTTGKSIFLPAGGLLLDSGLEDAGIRGYYWSSNIGDGFNLFAWGVCFDSGNVSGQFGRCFGRSVRPVLDENL